MADSGEPVSKRLRRRTVTSTQAISKSPARSLAESLPATRAKSSSSSENVPAQRIPSNSLLILTDECLKKLFERLDVASLCQMANVCKRFRPITEQAFSESRKEFVYKDKPFKNSVFRRVLCKFGHLITSIDVDSESGDEKADVNAIVKYCDVNKLEKLTLSETTINCDVVKPLFSRLKLLDLASCDFTGNRNDLFSNCPNLETFRFQAQFGSENPLNYHFSIAFVVKKFPKLKSLAFDCSYTAFDALHHLLPLNPQLKELEIIAPAEDIYIQMVVQYAKNLESLAIHPGFWSTTSEIQTRKELLNLSKLKKLRKLYLTASDEIYAKSAAPLLDAFAKNKLPIDWLDLLEFSIDSKAIQSTLKLKAMKFLRLDAIGNVTDADLVPLTKELPLLENIQLYFGAKAKTPITVNGLAKLVKSGKHLTYLALVDIKNLKIDKKAFDSLLKAAQSRGSEKKLEIDIFGIKNTTSFNVPENVRRSGSQHLSIEYTAQTEE